MRSLRSRLREKVLTQQRYSAEELEANAHGKTCWLCGSVAVPRFRLRDTTTLCYTCFRTVFFELVLPIINTPARTESAISLISKIEKLSQQHSKSDSSAIEVRLPSEVPSAIRSTRNSEGSPLILNTRFWECPHCTFPNTDLYDTVCAACGSHVQRSCICKECNLDCINVEADAQGIKSSMCSSGVPHVVWYCQHCQQFNTRDADYCSCGKPHEWICAQCTDRQDVPRNEDGLRYCKTCGGPNTPDDVILGQAAVDKELQRTAVYQKGEPIFGVNDSVTLRERRRQEEISENRNRLETRLRQLNMKSHSRGSDGNCLFSSIASQLFGRETLGHIIRLMIVEYMKENSDEYALLFDGDKELNDYLSKMRRPGTWGDELCINAAARCFRVDIHVLSSTEGRWHLVFRHDDLTSSHVQPCRGRSTSVSLFLSYQSPVHYEDLKVDGIVTLNFTKDLIPKLQNILDEEARSTQKPAATTQKKAPARHVIPLPLHRCGSSKSIRSVNPPEKLPARANSTFS